MSDDHRIWRRGEDGKNLIIKLIFELSGEELLSFSDQWTNRPMANLTFGDSWVYLAIERAKERLLYSKTSTI